MPKSPIPVKEEDLSTRQLLFNLNKRLSSATIFLGAAVAGLGVAFSALLPLKETKPYIIEVARDGSAVVPAQTEAVAYNPSFDSLTFFLRRWVVDAFTINQYSTVKTLDPRARSFLRGENALGAYRDFLSSFFNLPSPSTRQFEYFLCRATEQKMYREQYKKTNLLKIASNVLPPKS